MLGVVGDFSGHSFWNNVLFCLSRLIAKIFGILIVRKIVAEKRRKESLVGLRYF